MNKQYKCKHFAIHELVPKEVYEKYGERAWQFLDVHALVQLDMLRVRYGSMTINNYFWGGNYYYSYVAPNNLGLYPRNKTYSDFVQIVGMLQARIQMSHQIYFFLK